MLFEFDEERNGYLFCYIKLWKFGVYWSDFFEIYCDVIIMVIFNICKLEIDNIFVKKCCKVKLKLLGFMLCKIIKCK